MFDIEVEVGVVGCCRSKFKYCWGMVDRKLEVLLKFVIDLKKVNKIKMYVYVVVWVDFIIWVLGFVDRINGSNFVWEIFIILMFKGCLLG